MQPVNKWNGKRIKIIRRSWYRQKPYEPDHQQEQKFPKRFHSDALPINRLSTCGSCGLVFILFCVIVVFNAFPRTLAHFLRFNFEKPTRRNNMQSAISLYIFSSSSALQKKLYTMTICLWVWSRKFIPINMRKKKVRWGKAHFYCLKYGWKNVIVHLN